MKSWPSFARQCYNLSLTKVRPWYNHGTTTVNWCFGLVFRLPLTFLDLLLLVTLAGAQQSEDDPRLGVETHRRHQHPARALHHMGAWERETRDKGWIRGENTRKVILHYTMPSEVLQLLQTDIGSNLTVTVRQNKTEQGISPDSSIGSFSRDFLTWSDSPVRELSSIFRSLPCIRIPSAGSKSPDNQQYWVSVTYVLNTSNLFLYF